MSGELAYRDRPPRRGQLLQMARHRIAEVEPAAFDQLHHRHADKGLGQRRYFEHRGAGDRHGILDVRQPEVLQELDAFLPDDRNLHAWNPGRAHLARKIRS